MCEADKAPRGEIKIVARCFARPPRLLSDGIMSSHDENVKFYQSPSDVPRHDTLTPKLERCSLAMPIFAEHRFLSSFRLNRELAIVDKVAFGQK